MTGDTWSDLALDIASASQRYGEARTFDTWFHGGVGYWV
jgi:hypothetical protein